MVHVDASRRQASLAKSPRCAPAPLYRIPPRPADLTHRQEQLYLAMRDLAITLGRPATATELGRAINATDVHKLLHCLVRKGRVRKVQYRTVTRYVAIEPAAKSKGGRRR
jgi:hypothetical protein